MGARAVWVTGLACASVLACAGPAGAQIRAGVGVEDATWHVGASAGQYASTTDPTSAEMDPSVHQLKNAPSYGVQSRLRARAVVVSDGQQKMALVSIDLYIPQDLLWRRTAQLLEAAGTGIGKDNLVMSITHDHSSPYYTSTAWGAWTFQDVFDIRAYDYYAHRLAAAVQEANANLVPVRVGGAVTEFAKSNRNALGPAVADDGTPAGFPDSYTDRDMALVRFDDISDPDHPKPLVNLANFSIHPEGLEGNNLISADFVAPMERMLDRATGAVTIWTQNAVGNSESERSAYHSIHDRFLFDHRQYGQVDYHGSLLATAFKGLWDDIGRGGGRVPWFTDGPVRFADHWFPGPLTHPYPAVSNCRTDQILAGNPQLPIVGLPDCSGARSAFSEVGFTPPPDPAQNPGPSLNDIKRAGIPIPDNYGALSYTALEEDVSVHLQAFRIGDILVTVCSCEQWADQAKNIKSRTNRVAGDEWMGFDWATYRGLDDTGHECFELAPYDGSAWSCPHPDSAQTAPCARTAGGAWSCPDPRKECLLKGAAFTNTCRGKPFDARLPDIPDERFQRMKAQVRSCANGWNALDWAFYAESEPVDVRHIKGSYTCDDTDASARMGYRLTIPLSMANDYNGYIATYREYQRGDHYRKALTGWGPHSSDYIATRLVKLGRGLNGGPALDRTVEGAPDPDADQSVLDAKTAADQLANDVKAETLGTVGGHLVSAYTALLPDDAGKPEASTQPKDIQRFDAAVFTWRGGSNYTDNPVVRVERSVRGRWEPFADQSGEVVTTVKYPAKSDLPAYLSGGVQWRWTATFEAFVSQYDLLATPAATPAGTYRFVVDGRRRTGGRPVGYRVVSDPFRVDVWRGITVDDVRREPDGRVSLRLGPRTEVRVPGGTPDTATIGPIDYPDSYTTPGRPKFIHHERTAVRDPEAPDDPSRFEWFCFDCSFRPWRDAGDARRVVITFARGDQVVRARARRSANGRWYTRRHLHDGESAYVCASGARDAWGDVNGEPSAVAGHAVASPRC